MSGLSQHRRKRSRYVRREVTGRDCGQGRHVVEGMSVILLLLLWWMAGGFTLIIVDLRASTGKEI